MPVPPLQGEITRHHDDRWRTWTVEHIPDFEDLPDFEPGMRSPVLVTLDGWHVNWLGDGEVAVWHDNGERYPDLDHARFNTVDEFHAAAWEAGLLGLMVYENVAHEYGLPSSLAWIRTTPDVMTTDCGHDERRVTDARTVEWVRILDPDHDLTPAAWKTIDGPVTDVQAVFVVSAYGANDLLGITVDYVEIEYGMVVYADPDAEDDTELFSNYVYETVAGATDASPDALDGYLTADYTATFQNLGPDDDMADSVWNGCIEDAALHLGNR